MKAPFPLRVLRGYQQRSATYLYERDAAFLVAPLGAGKGAAALTAFADLVRDKHRRHALVIAPKLVATTVWPAEITSWAHLAHLRFAVLDGSPERRRSLLAAAPTREVTVIGVDLVPWLVGELAGVADDHSLFDVLIIDETSRLKDPSGKRARSLLKVAGRFRTRWGLTGTPRPNGSQDLFMPAAIITDGTLWGRAFVPWQKRHFWLRNPVTDEWVALPEAEEQIAVDFGTVAMTVADDAMPDLPSLNIVVTRVALPDTAMATYKMMQQELFTTIGERSIEAVSPMIATGKCAQLANGFIYGEDNDDPVEVHTVKIDWLKELVENSRRRTAADRLRVHRGFAHDLARLRQGAGIGRVDPGEGGIPPDQGLERWRTAAAGFPSSECGARDQSAARRVAHGMAVAELVGRTHGAGDRADLPAGADAARDHSRLHRRGHHRRDEARSGDRQDVGAGSVPTASGAGVMQERTAFRLAMLANGYQPLLNDCKRPIEKGWPKRRVNEAEVLSWDRSALSSTGLRIDGDLAVIDADVADASLVAILAGALDERFSALFRDGLVRHAGGAKEAWIARVDEPFRRLASRRWYRGGDPDDPAVPKHMVECFGSLGTRRFAIDGPHSRNRQGEVIRTYQFTGGVSPATTPRASLPMLPKAAYALACELFDDIAAAAGLTAIKVTGNGQGETTRVFELDDDTEIETREHGAMTLTELECLMRAQRAHGGVMDLRCSGSFHDRTRVRTDSHLIGWGRYGISIHDTMTGTTWHRRGRAPSARFEFLSQLRARNPFHE